MLLGRDADYEGKECVHDGKVTKSPDSKIAHSKMAQNPKWPTRNSVDVVDVVDVVDANGSVWVI